MPLSESFLNKCVDSVVSLSASVRRIVKFGNVHGLVEHDGKVHTKEGLAVADVTNLRRVGLGFSLGCMVLHCRVVAD